VHSHYTPFPASMPHRLRSEFSELRLPGIGLLNDPFCCMTLLAIICRWTTIILSGSILP